MAQDKENKNKKSEGKEAGLIDPIYRKFVHSIMRSVGSTDFYDVFMDSIDRAENEFQFSNRKVQKTVDLDWIDAIEESLPAMQEIVNSPRNVIKEEEIIVNVGSAKKAGPETIRHLAQHASLVEDFDEGRGEVRPSRLMQRIREDTIGIYENRLVFTTLETAFHFVKIRYDALLEAMSEEYGAKLKVRSELKTATEQMHFDMFIHIREIEGAIETDDRLSDVFSRISRVYRILSVLMNSQLSQQLSRLSRVGGTLNKTNVLRKNKNYRKITELFEFLRHYEKIGYMMKVIEQNPTIDERFQTDIYHNIMFNYMILKSYLQDEEDRAIPEKAKGQKKLHPKFVKEIIEELTEDYDLPDVEIRKVLIEELTKSDLEKMESAERRKLVDERKAAKKAEAERIKAEKAKERARIKAEKEAEKARLKAEKKAEEQRLAIERMEQRVADNRRRNLFLKDINFFKSHLELQLYKREQELEEQNAREKLSDYADAARLLQEAEERKAEDAARAKARRKEERERIKYEQAREAEREREEKEQAEKERTEKEQAEKEQTEAEVKAKEAEEPAGQEPLYENDDFISGLQRLLEQRADEAQAEAEGADDSSRKGD